jgi:hypothetical protein
LRLAVKEGWGTMGKRQRIAPTEDRRQAELLVRTPRRLDESNGFTAVSAYLDAANGHERAAPARLRARRGAGHHHPG